MHVARQRSRLLRAMMPDHLAFIPPATAVTLRAPLERFQPFGRHTQGDVGSAASMVAAVAPPGDLIQVAAGICSWSYCLSSSGILNCRKRWPVGIGAKGFRWSPVLNPGVSPKFRYTQPIASISVSGLSPSAGVEGAAGGTLQCTTSKNLYCRLKDPSLSGTPAGLLGVPSGEAGPGPLSSPSVSETFRRLPFSRFGLGFTAGTALGPRTTDNADRPFPVSVVATSRRTLLRPTTAE